MKLDRSTVVWVTGASSGIGRAFALELASRCRLILSGRDEERLRETASLCAQRAPAPGGVLLLPFDLEDRREVETAGGRAASLFGRIDVLALCAGVSQRERFEDTALGTMDRLLEVNYRAPMALVSTCLPLLRRQGGGWVLAVSSLAGKVGAPLRTGYSAAKHALQGFCNALRAELQGSGVGVTVAVPGFVRTEISRHALTGDGEAHGRMDRLQAAGISPERCARDMVRALQRGRAEVRTGFGLKGWLALAVSHLSIGLYGRLIARNAVSRKLG